MHFNKKNPFKYYWRLFILSVIPPVKKWTVKRSLIITALRSEQFSWSLEYTDEHISSVYPYVMNTVNNAGVKGHSSYGLWNIPTNTFCWYTCMQWISWTVSGWRGTVPMIFGIYQQTYFIDIPIRNVKTSGISIGVKQCLMTNCICISYQSFLQILKFTTAHTTQ